MSRVFCAMHVYRIENEKGFGPYGWAEDPDSKKLPKSLFRKGGALECECDRHPGPIMSAMRPHIKLRPGSWAFGFDSLPQYQRWWGEAELAALEHYAPGNYGLAVYDIPRLLDRDPHQVMWLKATAKRISWTPIAQLHTKALSARVAERERERERARSAARV